MEAARRPSVWVWLHTEGSQFAGLLAGDWLPSAPASTEARAPRDSGSSLEGAHWRGIAARIQSSGVCLHAGRAAVGEVAEAGERPCGAVPSGTMSRGGTWEADSATVGTARGASNAGRMA